MAGLETLTIAAGAAKDFVGRQLYEDDGITAATRWASGDTLATVLWSGDDQASLATPTATWVTAASGTYTLSFAAANTSSLDPGDYYLRVLATDVSDSNRVWEVDRVRIRVLPVPGAATALAVYGTLDDLRRVAGNWLDDLIEGSTDQVGFAEQRSAARDWFDSLLQRHYRRDEGPYREDSIDHLYDSRYGRYRRLGEHDVTLQDWLDDDRLVLTTPAGKRIVDACSYYALARICDRQVTDRDGDPWPMRAKRYRLLAEQMACTITAEIDTTEVADGVGDLVIDLGTADRLRA